MTKSDQPDVINAFYAPTLQPAIEELRARGVELESLESLFHRSLFELRTPFMRIPLFLSRRFWAFAQAETNDPLIGLVAGRRFLSTSTNGLTYLFDVAASLESACAYFAEYFPFFNGHFQVKVVHTGQVVELRLLDCGSLRATAPITDYIIISICSMLRRKLLASGLEQDPILRVGLAHPLPLNTQAHEQAIRVPVYWGQYFHVIALNPVLFKQPLTPGNHELEQALVGVLEQTRSNSSATLLELVSDHLIANLTQNGHWQGFCATHHLLERTAARRLKALGWHLSELLDECRRYRAEDLLQVPELELVQISDQLGYSDVQSFNRSCLRWFSSAPGLYRSRLNLS